MFCLWVIKRGWPQLFLSATILASYWPWWRIGIKLLEKSQRLSEETLKVLPVTTWWTFTIWSKSRIIWVHWKKLNLWTMPLKQTNKKIRSAWNIVVRQKRKRLNKTWLLTDFNKQEKRFINSILLLHSIMFVYKLYTSF